MFGCYCVHYRCSSAVGPCIVVHGGACRALSVAAWSKHRNGDDQNSVSASDLIKPGKAQGHPLWHWCSCVFFFPIIALQKGLFFALCLNTLEFFFCDIAALQSLYFFIFFLKQQIDNLIILFKFETIRFKTRRAVYKDFGFEGLHTTVCTIIEVESCM